jgi:hypothetical protein
MDRREGADVTDCEKAQELMSQYIDGEITDSDKDFLTEHLKTCHECSEMFSILAEVSFLMADDVEPPPELLTNVMQGVNKINDERKSSKKRGKVIYFKYLAVAACFALVITAGIKLMPGFGLSSASTDSAMIVSASEADTATTAEVYPLETQSADYESAEASDSSVPESASEETSSAAKAPSFSASSSAGSADNDADNSSAQDSILSSSVAPDSKSNQESASTYDFADYLAILYVNELPETVDDTEVFELDDGSLAVAISAEDLDTLLDELNSGSEEYEITYQDSTNSDMALLVCNSNNN